MKVQDFAVAMEDQGQTFPVIFGDLPYFVTNCDFDDVINCSKFLPDDPEKYQLNFVEEFAASYHKLAAENSVRKSPRNFLQLVCGSLQLGLPRFIPPAVTLDVDSQ